MKYTTRIISLLLAALCVCTTACTGGGEPVETTAAPTETTAAPTVTTAPAETEAPETEPVDPRMLVKDDLPEGLTFEGRTFNIYAGDKDDNIKFFGGPEELTGELIEDTVYRRNAIVEDRLKVNIEVFASDDTYSTIAQSLSKLVMAQDTTYDLFLGHQCGVVGLTTQHLFLNTYELDHINFSQPWWNNNYMEELSLGKDQRYFLSGDYFLTALENARVVYFNKSFYQDQFGDPNDLYRKVLDGDWMMEDMQQLVSASFSDLNNNGACDIDDRLGFVCWALMASVDAFVYGSDINFTTRDEGGFLKMNLANNERAAELLETLLAFFYGDGTFYNTGGKQVDVFKTGNSLFLGNGTFSTIDTLRDMEQDFGILPQPKMSAEQQEYRTLIHDTTVIGCVPVTSLNTDMTGAILEALSVESYRSVYPAYYETALKVKYVRDDISSQIIDLVKDTLTTSFIYVYSVPLGGVGKIYRTLVENNSNTYMSMAKAQQRLAERNMETLIASFSKQG